MEKLGVAAVANSDVKHLRRGAEKQGSVIEVNVLAEDDYLFISSPVPYLCVSSP
jgi:hypothetical protein